MSEDLLTGSTGTSGQATSVSTTTTAGASSQTPSNSSGTGAPASWRDGLPPDLKDNPALSTFTDVANLAKSYIHAQGQIGKKGVMPPGEKATDEQMALFYKELGLPDPDKYEIETPKDVEIDGKFLGEFKDLAHKNGVMPKQAKAVLDWYVQKELARTQEMKAQQEVNRAKEVEGLKKEWGEGYDKQVALARMAAKDLGGEEFIGYLTKTGLANDTTVAKFLAKVGKLMGEDKIRGDGVGKFGKTPAELKSEINDVYANPKHPYFDRTHPGHLQAVEKMAQLQKLLYGE